MFGWEGLLTLKILNPPLEGGLGFYCALSQSHAARATLEIEFDMRHEGII